MKKILLTAMLALSAAGIASAQYYSIVNQATNALQNALSGSSNYKGFVEASYVKGLGNLEADFVELSTTQGYQYNSWFYMGVGLGVQLVCSHSNDLTPGSPGDWNWDAPQWGHGSTETGVMIPLYTDFRFTPMGPDTGIFIDVRAGCSFLVGSDYIRIRNGYLTNQQYFYLKPTLGVKVPVSKNHPRQAIDFGVSYQLLTSNYWSGYSSNRVLSGLGVSVGFEW